MAATNPSIVEDVDRTEGCLRIDHHADSGGRSNIRFNPRAPSAGREASTDLGLGDPSELSLRTEVLELFVSAAAAAPTTATSPQTDP